MADAGPRLSEALFGKKADDAVWQDREIRFDLAPQELQCRRGELPLKSLVRRPPSLDKRSAVPKDQDSRGRRAQECHRAAGRPRALGPAQCRRPPQPGSTAPGLTRASAPLAWPQEEVEDTKGNNGERGDLLLTSLRLLWVSQRQRRTNISIGYNCITSIVVKEASSRLKGRRRR
jgi:hypothetical protein